MRIICTLTVLLFFAFAVSSAEKKQSWQHSPKYTGALAMKKVRLDWRPTGWMVEFNSGREGYLGMAYKSRKKIVIWIRHEHTSTQVAATLVHEFAHVFDWAYMTDEMHTEWLKARNLPSNTFWWYYPSCKGCGDYDSDAGDFAESVKWTFQGPETKFYSKLGPPPNEEQQSLIRRWFSQVAGK